MQGDAPDFAARLRAMLPRGWFGDDAPVLTAVLTGFGSQFAAIWGLLTFAQLQTRVTTATDIFLDIASVDFLGNFPRRLNELDAPYSVRLRREVMRPRNTRAAIIQVLQDLTGNTPTVFRPSNPTDTGGYGVACGYGVAGAWGSLAVPFQAFVSIARGTAPGAGNAAVSDGGGVSGWGDPLGGYGAGAFAWGDGQPAQGGVTDNDIFAAVASVMPAGHVFWTNIGGTPLGGAAALGEFFLDVNTLA